MISPRVSTQLFRRKNITFPTDSKLHRKIIDKCRKIAEKEDLPMRQSFLILTLASCKVNEPEEPFKIDPNATILIKPDTKG